ncbi:MAG: hypothetical protein ACRDTT_29050 [Pseudonocardiaceae bacterium]
MRTLSETDHPGIADHLAQHREVGVVTSGGIHSAQRNRDITDRLGGHRRFSRLVGIIVVCRAACAVGTAGRIALITVPDIEARLPASPPTARARPALIEADREPDRTTRRARSRVKGAVISTLSRWPNGYMYERSVTTRPSAYCGPSAGAPDRW